MPPLKPGKVADLDAFNTQVAISVEGTAVDVAIFLTPAFFSDTLGVSPPSRLLRLLLRVGLPVRQAVETAIFVVGQPLTPSSPGGSHWLRDAPHTPEGPLSH